MAQFVITVPDALVPKIIKAIRANFADLPTENNRAVHEAIVRWVEDMIASLETEEALIASAFDAVSIRRQTEKQVQRMALKDWTLADAPYVAGVRVMHDDKVWLSTVGNNTSTPGTAGWRELG